MEARTWGRGSFEESGYHLVLGVWVRGRRPNPGLLSAVLSSVSPLPPMASEFSGSTEEATHVLSEAQFCVPGTTLCGFM